MRSNLTGMVTAVLGGVVLIALGIVLGRLGQFAMIASDACVTAADSACDRRMLWGASFAALPQVPVAVVAGAFSVSRAAGGPGRAVRPLLGGVAAMVGAFAAGMLWITIVMHFRDGFF
jgi:hypothetical protein